MRTEKINNRINFNGYKLQTFKTPLKKIEIYSLNSQDKPFIERMLNVVGGHKFTEDKHLIGGENTKEVFRRQERIYFYFESICRNWLWNWKRNDSLETRSARSIPCASCISWLIRVDST